MSNNKNNDLSLPSFAKRKPSLLATIICILASCFYMYEFILQVSPAVMTNQLISDLGLNAITLGTVAAFYYYSYTPMQLPAGFLFDRFGPRRLLTGAILTCAVGAFLFGSTSSIAIASAGRFMMGMGSAFSFIGTLVLISRWFPSGYFAFLTGLVELMSSVGAIVGEAPLTIAVEHWGWRQTIITLGIAGVILALLVWLIVRDSPEAVSKGHRFQATSKKTILQSFHQVAANSQTWFIALYCMGPYHSLCGFVGRPFSRCCLWY